MKIIRKPAVRGKVTYSGMHIDRLEKAGKFPKRIRLGDNAVGWLESEIDAWIQERIDARDSANGGEDDEEPDAFMDRTSGMSRATPKWPPGKEAAPPGQGGAERKGIKNKCNCNYNNYPSENQGPRHIGEIADGLLLEAAAVRFEKLAKRLSRRRGAEAIDINREMMALAVLINDLRGGRAA